MGSNFVCYTVGYNFVTSSNEYFPCGPSNITGATAQSCCFAGDYCMQDSICHYTHGGVPNGTGYYMAGCTDKTWKDPACPKACTSEYGADVIYDQSEKDWHCCQVTEDSKDCTSPSNFTVQAPAPGKIETVKHIAHAIPTVTLTTAIGQIKYTSTQSVLSGSATSTGSGSSKKASSGGLSGGAQAGIAVGVIIGVLLIFAAAFFFVWQRRKKQKLAEKEQAHELPDGDVQAPHYGSVSTFSNPTSAVSGPPGSANPMSELSTPTVSTQQEKALPQPPVELQERRRMSAQELPGDQRPAAELDAHPNYERS